MRLSSLQCQWRGVEALDPEGETSRERLGADLWARVHLAGVARRRGGARDHARGDVTDLRRRRRGRDLARVGQRVARALRDGRATLVRRGTGRDDEGGHREDRGERQPLEPRHFSTSISLLPRGKFEVICNNNNIIFFIQGSDPKLGINIP